MSEQGEELHPTRRFSDRAEHYAKHRPGYPATILSLLATECGLSPRSTVADVGSGTGILSEMLLQTGSTVFAIEPNARMRAAAERSLAHWPTFHSVDGTAEATTLPGASVDGVLAAQAFHWFDGPKAVAEFRRITRPGGFLALIWNARDTAASGFMAEYEAVVREFGSDVVRSGGELVSFERLRELLGPNLRSRTYPNQQELDWEGLRGRVLSASYMPLEGQRGHEPMIARLESAFERHHSSAGRVRLEYQTQVYLTTLR